LDVLRPTLLACAKTLTSAMVSGTAATKPAAPLLPAQSSPLEMNIALVSLSFATNGSGD
jgi:hypothetical protein